MTILLGKTDHVYYYSSKLASLKNISNSLSAIKDGLDANVSGDLLSSDIRTALYDLGEITGEVTNEDKLDFIFSKFCIGKWPFKKLLAFLGRQRHKTVFYKNKFGFLIRLIYAALDPFKCFSFA